MALAYCMKRTSAQAIDGWAKCLIDFIVDEDAQFAGNLAYLTQMVLRGQFGLLVMRCIRTARLVPIPKSEGGVRPIAVSRLDASFKNRRKSNTFNHAASTASLTHKYISST